MPFGSSVYDQFSTFNALISDNHQSTPSEIVPETIVELEAPEIPEVPAAPLEDQGQTAVALYEYVAAEDNEITFRENDIITQIEFSSDDWWQGTAPNGLIGLFPFKD
ncbi:SH3 domain-containing protein [Endogone sp. FLAS-F59071]|nr:SH3 domain-containing protein [Endogone sp. FLAS-F59071]|eukprot:RUS12574.1 SH3 domain-containing protein [Endogone sp. FLAS-F59071]